MADSRSQQPDGDDGAEPDPRFTFANERTFLAWIRTAISFAAVGGVVLKRDVILGLILLALAPVIWQLGRPAYRRPESSSCSPAWSWRWR